MLLYTRKQLHSAIHSGVRCLNEHPLQERRYIIRTGALRGTCQGDVIRHVRPASQLCASREGRGLCVPLGSEVYKCGSVGRRRGKKGSLEERWLEA